MASKLQGTGVVGIYGGPQESVLPVADKRH